MKYLIGLVALLAPMTVSAANNVALESTVLVERSVEQPDGTVELTLEDPARVVPGDNLVFVLNYENSSGEAVSNFVATNPLPQEVAFRDTNNSNATFSVDGGANYAPLSELTVTEEDGSVRPAVATDVTHVRWTFANPIPAGSSGQLSFRGVVK